MFFTKKIREQYIGFDDLWLMILGIPTLALLMDVFLDFHNFSDPSFFFSQWARSTYFTAFFWVGNRWMIVKLRQRMPSFATARKRILLQAFLSIALSFIIGPIVYLLLKKGAGFFDVAIHPDHEKSAKMASTIIITLLLVFIYEVVYFYAQLKNSLLEKEAVKQAHIQSQWEGLRNQVNPHFLFNSLNTLMSIVDDDTDLAKRFLKKLSKVYRYILESREDPLITLQDEMEFIHSYVFLQQERFKGNLNVNFDIPDKCYNYHIVPLSLQILFENAIKHNIISSRRPLQIEVFVQNNPKRLVIRNNLQRKSHVIHSTKVGLENLRKRYSFFIQQAVEIEETEASFSVAIPLIIYSNATTDERINY